MDELKNLLLSKYNSVAAWKQLLFSHKGRIGRLELFLGYLVNGIFLTIFYISAAPFRGGSFEQILPPDIWMVLLILLPLSILSFFISINLFIKRLRDLELSPWLTLIMLVPYVSFFFGMFLLFKKGKPIFSELEQSSS